ncbi:MAG: hypothetical protein WCF04_13720, partial [Candidatus Nanopelagicales bacterium]
MTPARGLGALDALAVAVERLIQHRFWLVAAGVAGVLIIVELVVKGPHARDWDWLLVSAVLMLVIGMRLGLEL